MFGCLEGIRENIKLTKGRVRVEQNTGVAKKFVEYGRNMRRGRFKILLQLSTEKKELCVL
jgi:hypothetical protein